MQYETLKIRHAGRASWVTLDRPPVNGSDSPPVGEARFKQTPTLPDKTNSVPRELFDPPVTGVNPIRSRD